MTTRLFDDDCKGTAMGRSMTNRAASPPVVGKAPIYYKVHLPGANRSGILCNVGAENPAISLRLDEVTCKACQNRYKQKNMQIPKGVIDMTINGSEPLPALGEAILETERKNRAMTTQAIKIGGLLVSKAKSCVVLYIPVEMDEMFNEMAKSITELEARADRWREIAGALYEGLTLADRYLDENKHAICVIGTQITVGNVVDGIMARYNAEKEKPDG